MKKQITILTTLVIASLTPSIASAEGFSWFKFKDSSVKTVTFDSYPQASKQQYQPKPVTASKQQYQPKPVTQAYKGYKSKNLTPFSSLSVAQIADNRAKFWAEQGLVLKKQKKDVKEMSAYIERLSRDS